MFEIKLISNRFLERWWLYELLCDVYEDLEIPCEMTYKELIEIKQKKFIKSKYIKLQQHHQNDENCELTIFDISFTKDDKWQVSSSDYIDGFLKNFVEKLIAVKKNENGKYEPYPGHTKLVGDCNYKLGHLKCDLSSVLYQHIHQTNNKFIDINMESYSGKLIDYSDQKLICLNSPIFPNKYTKKTSLCLDHIRFIRNI